MIIPHDTSIQNVTSGSLKKLKRKNNKVGINTFSEKGKVNESQTKRVEEMSNISPMLFLQEIDYYKGELENLDSFAQSAFKFLKKLQLDLLHNTFSSANLANLRDILSKSPNKFITSELEDLSNQIKIRVEVEIAKREIT